MDTRKIGYRYSDAYAIAGQLSKAGEVIAVIFLFVGAVGFALIVAGLVKDIAYAITGVSILLGAAGTVVLGYVLRVLGIIARMSVDVSIHTSAVLSQEDKQSVLTWEEYD